MGKLAEGSVIPKSTVLESVLSKTIEVEFMKPSRNSEKLATPRLKHAKAFGAFYTSAHIADFLAWWAIRSPKDTVMDPSFGGGVFIRSACERLVRLGGRIENQVFGVEIDADVHSKVTDTLVGDFEINRANLLLADFFSIPATESRAVDAVIGNPPFIRYQRFSGEARSQALARSASRGVRLTELCSSWAPFLIHSIAMLRAGGRLAMVLPMEVGHAKYARPVLEHIQSSFGAATFLTFKRKLFPDLNEDTLLLLASDKGTTPSRFFLRDLSHPENLVDLRTADRWPIDDTSHLDADAIAGGDRRLIEYFIPKRARQLYRELKDSEGVQRLGDVADVGIGYVTGANDFFHLAPSEARRRRIPEELLKPAVRGGRALSGLRFTESDWTCETKTKRAGYLLHIGQRRHIPKCVQDYLDSGEAQGIPRAYKCRTRSPWYCVPHVYQPDAFLTYMSGVTPRLVANDAGVYAPNSLHVLRIHPLSSASSDVVAALWQTSLTRLSVEIEGRRSVAGCSSWSRPKPKMS